MSAATVGRLLIVLTMALVLGAGFCVTGSHPGAHHTGDAHGAVPNFCSGMLATSVTITPLVALALVGWVLTVMSASVPLATPFVLDPPPKLAFVR